MVVTRFFRQSSTLIHSFLALLHYGQLKLSNLKAMYVLCV